MTMRVADDDDDVGCVGLLLLDFCLAKTSIRCSTLWNR
jgi:hypothetical protein